MSKKSPKIAELIAACHGQRWDAHYLGYFRCFNEGLFYDSHDVLEELWLGCRHEARGNFYKGLIQFAGGFVHLKKNRLKPAAALFRLSASYLARYRPRFESLNVETILALSETWVGHLESGGYTVNPLDCHPAPQLALDEED